MFKKVVKKKYLPNNLSETQLLKKNENEKS